MENDSSRDGMEIDLLGILMFMLRRWYVFLIAMVAALAAGLSICEFAITPQYQSTTKIIVLNKQTSGALTSGDMQVASQLTKDYQELILSRDVLETVIADCGLTESYEQLRSRVDVVNITDTRILSITVEDPSPAMAQTLADDIRETAANHIRRVTDVEAVNVTEGANLPTERSSPSRRNWALISLGAGFLVVFVVQLIRFLADDSIKSSEDIEKYLGLSTLAMVPKADGGQNSRSSKKKKKKKTSSSGKSRGAAGDTGSHTAAPSGATQRR